MKGTLVVDTPQDYQAWLKERAELAGTQTTPPVPKNPGGQPQSQSNPPQPAASPSPGG
jgi:heme/copper-type cytochrome/quinol oxidase subunit 2